MFSGVEIINVYINVEPASKNLHKDSHCGKRPFKYFCLYPVFWDNLVIQLVLISRDKNLLYKNSDYLSLFGGKGAAGDHPFQMVLAIRLNKHF